MIVLKNGEKIFLLIKDMEKTNQIKDSMRRKL